MKNRKERKDRFMIILNIVRQSTMDGPTEYKLEHDNFCRNL